MVDHVTNPTDKELIAREQARKLGKSERKSWISLAEREYHRRLAASQEAKEDCDDPLLDIFGDPIPEELPRADHYLSEAAKTFAQRRAVYGENYRAVGRVMKALFPDGLPLESVEDHNRHHIFVLMVVKLTRYAEQWDNGGHEDSLLDLSVYSAMLVSIDNEIRSEAHER
jgi:hypothetical protein